MRRSIIIISAICALCGVVSANELASWMVSDRHEMPEQVQAPCPTWSNPAWGGNLIYNLGCIPWDLEFEGNGINGDLTDAYFQWYRYPEGSSPENAVACDWQTDHTTFTGFMPKTDEMGSVYYYFCKVTTPSCPEGSIQENHHRVQIGSGGDPCVQSTGKTFTITKSGSFITGGTVTITATINADGGRHSYTWYHNGVEMDTTINKEHYEFVWDFHAPKLIIHNVTPEDGGTYSIVMQDGTECFIYSNPERVLVDNPTCGPVPNLIVSKSAICEGDEAATSLTNNTLAAGEIGEIMYMVKPDDSNPTATAPGTWKTDMPGLYQFKYVVNNPDNASCFRESKVVTIRVSGSGEAPTITPDAEITRIGVPLHFTTTGLKSGETGKISWSKDGSSWTDAWQENTMTTWEAGDYTVRYTIKTPSGCDRYAETHVYVYSCGYVQANMNGYVPSPLDMGKPVNLNPSIPTEPNMVGILSYSLDGGPWVEIPADKPFYPTEPGTYEFIYVVKHSDSRVTECYSEATRTIVVKSCGTTAKLSTDKTTLKVGESATLTYPAPESSETAELTYTKDGGAAQTLTGTTFSPSTPGIYELTYTITSSCATSSESVTINVYDCGPEATITASRTTIRPNDPITITVSAPGADETASLTVSYNGGTPQTVEAASWSAMNEGTYIFEYKIIHDYIDCARSDQVTVSVSDCGTAVLLTADKSIMTLGESINLTASREPLANETPSLSLSVNGGAAQPISNPVLPMNYTPTEVGTYSMTYLLHNDLMDCESSSEVLFSVFECGPNVSIDADKPVIHQGEGVNLTLSEPGADETATLMVSINGGAAVPVTITSSTLTYTPQGVGEYVFNYTITHPFIDCARTASVTVNVYDCGTSASITADQTTLSSGSSTILHLSSVSSDETATLTVAVNGGTAMPVTITSSSMLYTPEEAGTYEFTYTVSHSLIDCETSAHVTLNVYECGSEAKISLSSDEARLLHPISITLSTPNADETATLMVSVNGSADTPVAIESSPVIYTPTDLGTYVFTYTITHPYLSSCTRTATANIVVIEAEMVFDDSNGTHVWSDEKNWWPAYNRIPTVKDSVVIRKACTVDLDNAITNDLTFDGGSVTIPPTGALLVKHRLFQTTNSSISVLSDDTGNGALVLGPENKDITASVQFYSMASGMNEINPSWQYMGSPMQEHLIINSAYPQAMFFEWTNTPNKQYGGNWQRIDSLAGALSPFTGYCITQNSAKTYLLQGKLNEPVNKSITIPYNDQGAYPGFAFVANSWVAPIDIASLQPVDFGEADATVYIMNTGMYYQAIQQQRNSSKDGIGAAAGQYNTIPIYAAPYLPNALSVIPPMQGFFVHTNAATTLNLDYNKAVFTPALIKISTTPMRAPQRTNDQLQLTNSLHLRVSGFGHEDEVVLIESQDFTPAFDNGWDGRKARSEKSDVSMAVLSEDGPLAVAALPKIEGAEIRFEGGNHKTYTLTIDSRKSEIDNHLYLLDKELGEYAELTEGASYTFKCGPEPKRFVITRLTNDERTNDPKAFKFLLNGILYIRIGERMYDGTGQLITQ